MVTGNRDDTAPAVPETAIVAAFATETLIVLKGLLY